MHFPSVRAPGYPHAGVLSLRKPVNNTASQQVADQTFARIFLATNSTRSRYAVSASTIIDRKSNHSLINVHIMNLHFLHLPAKNPKDESGKHSLITVQAPPHSSNEGSEFLDDAIRMKDQPLVDTEYTEESVAAGIEKQIVYEGNSNSSMC